MATVVWPANSGGGVDSAWFTATLAAITAAAPGLTDVIIHDECGVLAPEWITSISGTGSVSDAPSAFTFSSGATASSTAFLRNSGFEKFIPNLRTVPWAIAARITKVATNATCDHYVCRATDAATAGAWLGIHGATSQTNFAFSTTGIGFTDTGIAQSPAGTYDTVVLVNDGTNLFGLINGAKTVSLASSGMGTAAVGVEMGAQNGGTASAVGFTVDKIMVVMGPAT